MALTTSINGQEGAGFPVTKLAVKALLHAIPYAEQNFKVEHERNFVMQKIFEAIEIADVDVREHAMQSLVELARQEYEYLEMYFQSIAACTAKAATSDDQKVGAQGIEFWISLTDEELRR